MLSMDIHALYDLYLRHPVICTDTRRITTGCLFFALNGDNFDGNHFAQEALDRGAVKAIVSDSSLSGPDFIYTDNTLETLQALARHHRRQLKVPVLAITGSNGKTTTKELITAVLSTAFRTQSTAGNLNNHIGVPLTLLSIQPDVEIVVCEMGANHAGEIKLLCEIAEPSHGIITNIGNAHLEGFGSLDGVQRAKGELFDFLHQHNGFAFINIDDPRVRALGQALKHKTTFSLEASDHPDIHLIYIQEKDAGFALQNESGTVSIQTRMFGRYNAANMLAAYAIGLHFGVPQSKIETALAGFVSKGNRSEEVTHQNCHFVMDAYNANPSSMRLALQAFAEKHPHGWVVLGDMMELGHESQVHHAEIISLLGTLDFENVLLVGTHFSSALSTHALQDQRFRPYLKTEDLLAEWTWEACKGKTVFVKGSRSMQLERILKTE